MKRFALLFVLFVIPLLARAEGFILGGDITADDVTVTTGTLTSLTSVCYGTNIRHGQRSPVQKVTFNVTSHTDGVMSFTTRNIQGKVVGIGTDPGATAPTDNWDLEILDAAGFDALRAAGLNRDTANTEYANLDALGLYIVGAQTFAFSGMGSAKVATVCLWIEE